MHVVKYFNLLINPPLCKSSVEHFNSILFLTGKSIMSSGRVITSIHCCRSMTTVSHSRLWRPSWCPIGAYSRQALTQHLPLHQTRMPWEAEEREILGLEMTWISMNFPPLKLQSCSFRIHISALSPSRFNGITLALGFLGHRTQCRRRLAKELRSYS